MTVGVTDAFRTRNSSRSEPFFVTLNLFQGPFRNTHRSMPVERNPCVYILASGHYGTLYTGVTSDLMKRQWEHREGVLPGFTSRFGVYRLVHFEMFGDMARAIAREKQIKNWRREWKINLINGENPEWRDLAVGLGFEPMAPRGRRNGS
jgi:putative endonuclease